jgi:hypothetical protein
MTDVGLAQDEEKEEEEVRNAVEISPDVAGSLSLPPSPGRSTNDDPDMRRRLRESYTIQYIGMSKGELGVLSKREVCHHECMPTIQPTMQACTCF